MTKSLKIISVLLAIIMAFSFLTIPVRAEALLAAAAAVVLGLAVGAIAELSAGLITKAVEAGSEALEDAVVTWRSAFHNLNQQHNSILVEYSSIDSDSRYDKINRVCPNPELTGVELELATRICNTINSSGNVGSYLEIDPLSQTLVITFEGYQKLKNLVVNAWIAELNAAAGEALNEAVDGLPAYEFDFVGPTQGITIPSGTKRIGLTKDGFTFSTPVGFAPNGFFRVKQLESNYDLANYTDSNKDYCLSASTKTSYSCYGAALYVVFKGNIYYHRIYNPSETVSSRSFSLPIFINQSGEYNGMFTRFISSDGITLDKVATKSDLSSFYVGFVYSSIYTGYSYPDEDVKIDPAEMVGTTDGGTIDIPLTEDEAALVGGLGFGLLNKDSLLGFNADGSLASADGISIDKLQQILEALQNGTLEFDDIQSYLQTMSTLIANGNLTASEQQKLLENINANIATISKALEMEAEASIEVDKPDIDYSALIVEHTGLAEAKTIVETALPVVGQAKVLLDNLFEKRNTDDYVPTFAFYWDSDGDGISEKYTVLDLSFMEQTLTNANLTDKKRFTSPMTIRQFVQYLIILITYTLFAIKVLKKIPGLIGGVESAEDSASTIDKYNSKVNK